MNLLRHLPLSPNVRPLHAITYLLAVPLFSISFLVFLNASLSFLLTNLFLVPPSQLGSVVGTLGFVDELVAIVAAPTWGVLSDGRLGTRGVAVAGYLAISASLLSFVSLQSVYPGLVLGRMLFAAGAAAVTTMVSAILPEMTNAPPPTLGEEPIETVLAAAVISPPAGKLAGVVGVLSGVGALLALGVFLPLPSRFAGREGVTPAEAVRWAYWVVAGVAAGVAAWCAVGLAPPRNPGGGVVSGIKEWMWTKIWGGDRVFVSGSETRGKRNGGGGWGLVEAAKLAVTDEKIAVAYVGGFVARASSVGISLFIPLFVNHYFITTGRCSPSGTDLPSKDACKKAYVLASTLTGTSQLTALVLAPVFGIMTDRCYASARTRNLPLILSSALGIVSFTLFSLLPTPESVAAFIYAALAGASQIGAIVCSLGLLSRGIVEAVEEVPRSHLRTPNEDGDELDALLETVEEEDTRESFKGSIAGVYSLFGGAAILLLTKVGGKAFDGAVGAPFWMLAAFNAALGVVAVAVGVLGKR